MRRTLLVTGEAGGAAKGNLLYSPMLSIGVSGVKHNVALGLVALQIDMITCQPVCGITFSKLS